MFCCKTVKYDSVLSQNVEIRHFLLRNIKIWYLLSRNVNTHYKPNKWHKLRYELTPDFIQPWSRGSKKVKNIQGQASLSFVVFSYSLILDADVPAKILNLRYCRSCLFLFHLVLRHLIKGRVSQIFFILS